MAKGVLNEPGSGSGSAARFDPRTRALTLAMRVARAVYRAAEGRLFPEATAASAHWQRVAMNAAVDEYIAELGPEGLTAAEISGANHAGKPWLSHRSLDYPDFDLCADLTDDERYDVVICEQVLEHVVDPFAAARNLRRLCADGGHVIVSSPFLIKVHELPAYGMKDYWRFTPNGMRQLLERSGLEVERIGTWGNREGVVGNFDRWSAYRPWHSLSNEPDLPIQVWAFAHPVESGG